MLDPRVETELHDRWLPRLTGAALERLIDLLERDSDDLIHGAFAAEEPRGCIASQAAWCHPATCDLGDEAGIVWLARLARLNPATSLVVQAWDSTSTPAWRVRRDFLRSLRAYRAARRPRPEGVLS